MLGNPNNPNNPNNRNRQGSGFTNLNRIISANRQNQLGSTVGGGITQQAQGAKQALQQGLSGFQQQSQASRIDTEQNKQKVQNILEDPTEASEQDVEQFNALRSGRYSGPQNIQNEQQIINQARQSENLGRLAGTSGGRQTVLQRFVGGPGYTQGKQRLDDILLGQTGSQQLREAQRASQGLSNQAQNVGRAARAEYEYLANQASQFGRDVGQKYDVTTGSLQEQLGSLLQQKRTQQEEELAALKEGIRGERDLDEQALARFGLTGKEALFKEDLARYVDKSLNLDLQNIANQEQFNKAKALQRLGQQNISQDQAGFFGQFTDPSQAGLVDQLGLTKVDKDTIRNTLLARQEEAERGLQTRGLSHSLAGFGEYGQQMSNFATQQRNLLSGIQKLNAAIQNKQNELSSGSVRDNQSKINKVNQELNALKQQQASMVQQSQSLASDIQNKLNTDPKFAEQFKREDALRGGVSDAKHNIFRSIIQQDLSNLALAARDDLNRGMAMTRNDNDQMRELNNYLSNLGYFSGWYNTTNNPASAFVQREKQYKDYLSDVGYNETIEQRRQRVLSEQNQALKKAQENALRDLATGK